MNLSYFLKPISCCSWERKEEHWHQSLPGAPKQTEDLTQCCEADEDFESMSEDRGSWRHQGPSRSPSGQIGGYPSNFVKHSSVNLSCFWTFWSEIQFLSFSEYRLSLLHILMKILKNVQRSISLQLLGSFIVLLN